MMQSASSTMPGQLILEKVPTGIKGLDEILGGGLPKGRPTLVCGGPGCGKTLLAMEFLAKGAMWFNEPGVYMSFEETAEELIQNFSSLNIDLHSLLAANRLNIDYVRVERSEIEETGEYDLEGLFIRLSTAIEEIGARRVVLDTIESLFSGFANENILRSELRRLFHWLKEKGVTAIITGERGEGQLTRHGLEEYVSDCVILLDHKVEDRLASRYLRVVKYRGSKHSDDEFPFLIEDNGISMLPITSLRLDYSVSNEYTPTGIPRLDTMLGGKGFFKGSSILVAGTAGSGKTSLAAQFANSACERGEKCIFFAFEEPSQQIIRNMRSIGIELQRWVDQGLLVFHTVRPSMYGIERHLLIMQQLAIEIKPSIVVVDPITNLINASTLTGVKSMLVRLIDFFKMNHITAMFTSLTSGDAAEASTDVDVSSLMDSWLLVRNIESNGERNRGIYVLKSRGMDHSNQIREFRLTNTGIELLDVYLGKDGILIGSARVSHQAYARIEAENQEIEIARKKRELERKQLEVSSQIASLQSSIAATQEELDHIAYIEEQRKKMTQNAEIEVAQSRQADHALGGDNKGEPVKER